MKNNIVLETKSMTISKIYILSKTILFNSLEISLLSKIFYIYHWIWNPFALAENISEGLGRKEKWGITLHDACSTDYITQYMLWDWGYVLLENTITLINLAMFAIVNHYINV